MIGEIQKAIAAALAVLYPSVTIYTDYSPSDSKVPSFLITISNHSCTKQMSNKFKSTVSFDIQYFSGVEGTDAVGKRADCYAVSEKLFYGVDLVGGFRVLNKGAKITDEVLHFTFDIKYSEVITVPETVVQSIKTNSIIEE